MTLRQHWNHLWTEPHRAWQSQTRDHDLESWITNHPGTHRVLDLGCGVGRHSFWLEQQGHDVTAIDISDEAISRCLALQVSQGTQINFQQADALDSDLDLGAFDLVIDMGCWVCLNFAQDRSRMAQMVSRHLRPEGVYLLKVDSVEMTPYETGLCRRSLCDIAEAVEPHLRIHSVITTTCRGDDPDLPEWPAWLVVCRHRSVPARPYLR